jgi:PAS domain S-box-containing protein
VSKRPGIFPLRLSAQMVLTNVVLVILAAAAVGLPAIWFIRSQVDQQAKSLLDQGSQATRALYAARLNDLTNQAKLVAQQPRLLAQLMEANSASLEDLLKTFQAGMSLDILYYCNASQQPLAQTDPTLHGDLCKVSPAGYYLEPATPLPRLWMVASQPVGSQANSQGRVVVGSLLNDQFAFQMRNQTGMEQVLLANGQLIASGVSRDPSTTIIVTPQSDHSLSSVSQGLASSRFFMNNQPFDAESFPLGDSGAINFVVLPVSSLASLQHQFTLGMAASILAVMVLGSVAGVLLSRRISHPLADLADAAADFRKGDLATPVVVKTNIPEIALVGYTLEDARAALQHNLSQLGQEKAWMDQLLESIIEGIVTLDQHGRITFFSHGAERITGFKQSQALGRYCDDIFRPVEVNERFSQLLPPPGRQQKITLALRNGRQVTIDVTGAKLAPLEAGIARVVLVLRDVSDQEAVHRLLGDFLANIAHEFRTPLTALAASIELLLDQLPDLSQAELQQLLNSLHLGIRGLQTLFYNLLEGASIETGRFRVYPRPSVLKDIIDDAKRVMQPLLDKYGQHLVVDIPSDLPPVQADPRRTAQVLVNLLSNAIKYGPADAVISVAVAEENGEVKISVADRGPGIPPEQVGLVFTRFVYLGTGDERAQYGMGLGLSVVKAIAEAQGGEVGVANRVGGGAVFWFTLPIMSGAGDNP